MSADLKKFERAVQDAYERRPGSDGHAELKLWLGVDLIAKIKAALTEGVKAP